MADDRDKFLKLLDVLNIPIPEGSTAFSFEEAKAIAAKLNQPWPEPSCPRADEVSTDTIWLPQPYLLGTEEQARKVAEAILKVVANADQLD